MPEVQALLKSEVQDESWLLVCLNLSKCGEKEYPELLQKVVDSSMIETMDWQSKDVATMKEVLSSLQEAGKVGLYPEDATTCIWAKVLLPILRRHISSNNFNQLPATQQEIIASVIKTMNSQIALLQENSPEYSSRIRLFSTLVTSFEETYPGSSLSDASGLSILTLIMYSSCSLLQPDSPKSLQWDNRIKFFEDGVLSKVLNLSSTTQNLSNFIQLIITNETRPAPALICAVQIMKLAAPTVLDCFTTELVAFVLTGARESGSVAEEIAYRCSSDIVTALTRIIRTCGASTQRTVEELLFGVVFDAAAQLPFLIAVEMFITTQRLSTTTWMANHYLRLVTLLTERTRSEKHGFEGIIDQRICCLIDICISCVGSSIPGVLPSWVNRWELMLDGNYEAVSSLISRLSDSFCAWLSQNEHSFWASALRRSAEKSDLQTAAKLLRNVRIAPTSDWGSVYGATKADSVRCCCCCSLFAPDSKKPCQCHTVSVSQKSQLVPALQLLLREARRIISSFEKEHLSSALDVLGSVLGILKKTVNLASIEVTLSNCIENVQNDGSDKTIEMLLAMQRTALRVIFFSSNVEFSRLWDYCQKQTQSSSSPLPHFLLERNLSRANPSLCCGVSLDACDSQFTENVLKPTLESYRSRFSFLSPIVDNTRTKLSVTLTLQS
eukprot:TRINITY_DN4688_c0_g1_i2.p1 TRINITY_DN4688_c0_g1~~TRINITY_DN4688_c0_g1_i2.p1  ORF type:complete len:668 (+),score=68.54 TRINITY_DN4688_c0_g1_i2:87-2090(+)